MISIENKIRQKIVLAALLHDIGKFWERADQHWSDSEIIEKSFPNLAFNHTVPTYENNNPMYGHALWTQAFFDNFSIGKNLGLDDDGDVNLATLSARHHKPSTHLEGIISLADKWSSAIDRPDEGEEAVLGYKQVKDKWGDGFVKRVPLSTVFDSLNRESIDQMHSFNLKKLNVLEDDSIIPTLTIIDKNTSLETEYKSLWTSFITEFEQILKLNKDFDSFLISLLEILRNNTWCIPSATNLEPANVSLFEHLKTTAGIALSLFDFYNEQNTEISFAGNIMQDNLGESDSLMMVCIDISGIQKFIYDISNKRAAKSMKGRSFYLQLLMQNVLNDLLNHPDIKLYPTNVIYASGGKAYLILPNIEKAKQAIAQIDSTYQEIVWKDYQGKIYITFGHIAFGYKTFKDTNTNKWTSYVTSKEVIDEEKIKGNESEKHLDLGDIWRIVSDKAAAKKHTKFKQKVLEFKDLFKPIPYDVNGVKCAATGITMPVSEMKILEKGEGDNKDLYVLSTVYDQTLLGEKLKRGNYLVSYTKADKINPHIEINGTKYEIISGEEISHLPSHKYESAIVYAFNNTNVGNRLNNTGFKTMFYGGNEQPLKNDGNAKTFEDLCLLPDGSRTKLGILRMDVDNLGQIFINGFGDQKNGYITKKSFAAYSTLSFLLEAFFCGYINQIRQRDKYKDLIQILYSGGDDLFAIGRWDATIEFASDIRTEFSKFTCRKDITISGGIAIVGAKYPISKSAEMAGDIEKQAKDYTAAKNAINFFGETVNWGEEFAFVCGVKDSFCYFDGIVSRSLIQNIQKYKLIKDGSIKKEEKDFSYVWNSAYTISRTLERIKKENHPEAWTFVNDISKNIIHNDKFGSDRYLDLLSLGARWAEYLLKIKS